jgi:nicotinamide-nucleotide amidase
LYVELLTTGSELLRGDIPDTNAAHIAQELFCLGYEVRRKGAVPDDLELIATALREAAQRSGAMVVTGGLGPTADDLTAEAAAKAAGVPLEEHPGVVAAIRERFQRIGREMPPNNLRQAMVPRGSHVVISPVGTAPAFAVEIGGCRAWFTAGVPREMRYLLAKEIIPDLLERRPPGAVVRRRYLRCYGLPESRLDHMVRGAFEGIQDLEIGFKTEWPENVLLLFARGVSAAEAEARLSEAEARARSRIGQAIVAADGETWVERLSERLLSRGEQVALAEAGSDGYGARLFSDSPAGAKVLAGGVAAPTAAARVSLLGLSPEEAEGVAEPLARAMAEAARRRLGAAYGLGVASSHTAGERGGEGAIAVALASSGGVESQSSSLPCDREQLRRRAVFEALALLEKRLST